MEITFFEILFFLSGGFFGGIIGVFIGKMIKYKVLKKERQDSIKRSKSVILGEVYEKILPFLPNFPYSPKDMVFVGKGIDYIIFDGLSSGNLEEIVFLEVKSGKSRLNKNEKMIKNGVDKKQFSYREYRI